MCWSRIPVSVITRVCVCDSERAQAASCVLLTLLQAAADSQSLEFLKDRFNLTERLS